MKLSDNDNRAIYLFACYINGGNPEPFNYTDGLHFCKGELTEAHGTCARAVDFGGKVFHLTNRNSQQVTPELSLP